jgi:hypothetical protein
MDRTPAHARAARVGIRSALAVASHALQDARCAGSPAPSDGCDQGRHTVEIGTQAAPSMEELAMDDMKKGYREAEESSKEAWRNRDGESVKDALGNAGDDLRKDLGDAGDDTRAGADDAAKETEYERDANLGTPSDTTSTERRY